MFVDTWQIFTSVVSSRSQCLSMSVSLNRTVIMIFYSQSVWIEVCRSLISMAIIWRETKKKKNFFLCLTTLIYVRSIADGDFCVMMSITWTTRNFVRTQKTKKRGRRRNSRWRQNVLKSWMLIWRRKDLVLDWIFCFIFRLYRWQTT